MSDLTPVILVPGFYGFAGGGEAATTPDAVLTGRLLRLLEGGDADERDYQLGLPDEALVVKGLPPDPIHDGLEQALPEHGAAGRLLCFAYDWRKDLTASAARLAAELVEQAEALGTAQLDLVGVGPGGLVVRYLLESGALRHGQQLVRRSALIGTPHHGVPAALPLLHRTLVEHDDPDAAVRAVLDRFPAVIQLLPPRGIAYLYLAAQNGVRVEPFAWPTAFFGRGDDRPISTAAARELVDRNESLYGGLKAAFHSTWRRCLTFASASEPTHVDLHVELKAGAVTWCEVGKTPRAGDGLVPIASAILHPTVRGVMVQGTHLRLPGVDGLRSRLRAFLLGPLS